MLKKAEKAKKAFTIVELIIVIAIIAILAAVLIPTFVNVVNKANESSDMSAVRNMNTYLAIEDATKGDMTIADVYKALEENGIDAENYSPLYSGRYFYYDQNENRIVYTDGEYNVIYPEGIEKGDHRWYTLNGVIPEEDYEVTSAEADGSTWYTYSISSAGQLAKLNNDINDFLSGAATSSYFKKENVNATITGLYQMNLKIELTDDIDMMGAGLNINLYDSNFTFEGNGHTIAGIVNIRNFAVSNNNTNKINRSYGSGIVGYAYHLSGTNPLIQFNNLTVRDSYFGSSGLSGAGALVGFSQACDISVNDVTVENCSLLAGKGAGAIVGYLSKATLAFTGKNVIADMTLTADDKEGEGCVAGICGRFVLRDEKGWVTVKCESFSGTIDGQSVLQLDTATLSVSHYRSGIWFYADTSSDGAGYAVNEAPVYTDGEKTYTISNA